LPCKKGYAGTTEMELFAIKKYQNVIPSMSPVSPPEAVSLNTIMI
jgi:hypothetical protein